MFIPFKLLAKPYLEVTWDYVVAPNLRPCYQGRNQAQIPIRLFDLLKGVGTIQPKRRDPSWFTTLMDYSFLIETIYDAPNLKIHIDAIRENLDSEHLKVVSENMGVGLSVVVLSELFDVQQSTISRIKGTKKRPDWRCMLRDNRTLIVEAKGSARIDNFNKQINDAIVQKGEEQGDVRIATASMLKETETCVMNIVDPPITNDDLHNDMLRHIYRANHYTSVFSFLGEDVLSLYFEKMAKRLSGEIGQNELDDKELMFVELSDNTPTIKIDNDDYVGHLYGPTDGQYLFVGVNKKLLSFQGFKDFQDSDYEQSIEIDGNEYLVHKDGIIVVVIVNPDLFFNVNDIKSQSIGVSMDNIALKDIDSIKNGSFKRYVKYLVDKCADSSEWIDNGHLKARINSEEKEFWFYHVLNLKPPYGAMRSIWNVEKMMGVEKGILVTNLSKQRCGFDIPCIGREDFEKISESKGDTVVVAEVFGRR